MYVHVSTSAFIDVLLDDPDFPTHKANYRDFLKQNSHFRQPIKIQDTSIQRKVHQTYRLQFLKDVVLARALDDSTFTVLNACIIFNQTDIITHIQSDPTFLGTIVKLYVDEEMLRGGGTGQPPSTTADADKADKQSNGTASPSPPVKRYGYAPPEELSEEEVALRREVLFLLQQLCAMGKNVQLQARITLFRTLVDRGILFAVQWALGLGEADPTSKAMVIVGGEILTALLDHDLNGVRGHVMRQTFAIVREKQAGKTGADKAETILQTVCKLMVTSQDLAVQSLIGEALKSWLDIPSDSQPHIENVRSFIFRLIDNRCLGSPWRGCGSIQTHSEG